MSRLTRMTARRFRKLFAWVIALLLLAALVLIVLALAFVLTPAPAEPADGRTLAPLLGLAGAVRTPATSQESETCLTDSAGASRPRVSIVIPTYNEREVIWATVQEVLLTAEVSDLDIEVLVVDDDSPDKTWSFVEWQFRDDPVRVIRRVDERGLATAVLRGFQEANGEVLVCMDADGQHPPERLPDLVLPFQHEDVDATIGSRYVDGGGIDGWSRSRQVISRGGTLLAEVSVGRTWQISDPMSGFFAVRRSLVDDILEDLDPTGYKVLLEILARTDPRRVVEVPFTFRERQAGVSKLDARETLRFLAHLGGLSWREVDAVGVAILAVGTMMLASGPLPLAANVGLFGLAALVVSLRSARDLAADLTALDVEVATPIGDAADAEEVSAA